MAAAPWPYGTAGSELKEKVASAKVLAVGAGGIGCELLKTLVLTGFRDIEVVDLDTIETSNLNRQFLFRRRHVGRSKAEVAAEAVRALRPGVSVKPHCGNVKDAGFGVDFFKRFDLVMNGLDNLEARRHVNRLCLVAGVPLIESGSAGYLGQVTVHRKGETECFECQPKPVPKAFPVCTIRSTPERPIHCVIWAKDLLYQRLFGSPDAVSDLDQAAAAEGEDADAEAAATEQFFARREGEGSRPFAERIFTRVFAEDIQKVLEAKAAVWETRQPPAALDVPLAELPSAPAPPAAAAGGGVSRALGYDDAHAPWDLRQSAAVFLASVVRMLDEREGEVGSAVFDKDDDLAVDFVTAASNLRSLCFGIPTQSLFDTKGMAGNIVHAIATTNAVISGLIAIEALKLLAGAPESCKSTFILQHPSNRKLLTPLTLSGPNPGCAVCSTALVRVELDTAATTLGQFRDRVLRKHLGLSDPTLEYPGFMYEESADLETDEVEFYAKFLPMRLNALPGGGMGHGRTFQVKDSLLKCDMLISHRDGWDYEAHPEGFIVTKSEPKPAAGPQQDAAAAAESGGAKPQATAPAAKRKAGGAAAPVLLSPKSCRSFIMDGKQRRESAEVRVELDTTAMTLGEFRDRVLRKHLGFVEDWDLLIEAGFMYEESLDHNRDEYAENAQLLPILLSELPGSSKRQTFHVEGGSQYCDVVILHRDGWDSEAHPEGFIVTRAAPEPADELQEEDAAAPAENGGAKAQAGRPAAKRKAGDGAGQGGKRAKHSDAAEEDAGDAIDLSADDVIVLD